MAVINVMPVSGRYAAAAGAGQYAFVAGVVTLDGSGATTVDLATAGLASVTGAVACINVGAALADDAECVTVTWATTILSIWPQVATGATDPTLALSTNSALVISYLAWGTT